MTLEISRFEVAMIPAVLLCLCATVALPCDIYWTEVGASRGIYRAHSDGSQVTSVLPTTSGISDTDIDPSGGRLFYFHEQEIRHVGLNGDDVTHVWGSASPFQSSSMHYLRIDSPRGRVHWTSDVVTDTIQYSLVTSVRFDGSDVEGQGAPSAAGIGIDPSPGVVYYARNGDMWARSGNGGGDQQVLDNNASVSGVAFSQAKHKMYWATNSEIQRASPAPGATIESVLTFPTSLRDLAVDDRHGKIYWTDPLGGVIRRADLDGTHVEEVLTGLDEPYGLTLDTREVELAVEPQEVRWNPVVGTSAYDVVQGDLTMLRATGGDFSVSTLFCLADATTLTAAEAALVPASGQGYWYLARAEFVGGIDSSYGTCDASTVTPRDAAIEASELDCAPAG